MTRRKGRKRMIAARRHPGGQVVRRSPEERVKEVRAVVETARQRVYELWPYQASQWESVDAVGRAFLRGHFGDLSTDVGKAQASAMLSAARLYEQVQINHRRAVEARRMRSGGDLDRSGGYDASDGTEPLYVHWCENAEREMRETRRALLEAHPLAQLAVDAWVLEDKTAYGLLGELRVGLNALVRLYAIPAEGWSLS
jgi:hypothetical protein